MKKPISLVCIIDDDDYYVFALSRMMNLLGMSDRIISFPNGEDAIDYLTMVKDYPVQIPNIIFLDIEMPVMDGWEFLKNFIQIKDQLSKPVCVYIISSSNDLKYIQKAKEFPVVSDYLIKAIDKAELKRVLEEVQGRKEKIM